MFPRAFYRNFIHSFVCFGDLLLYSVFEAGAIRCIIHSMKPLYVFRGKVREGKKRGKDLGFPTANVRLSQSIPSSIYVSLVKIRNQTYHALTFIGDAKTFGETLFQAETYILDFNKNLYGQWMSIKLLKKIRENQKFTSAQDLIKQMKEDEKKARVYFKKM